MDRPGVDAAEVVQRRKRALRATTSAARRLMSAADRASASQEALERLTAVPDLRDVATVALYAPHERELDVSGAITVLRQRGARILLPRVDGDELHLAAVHGLRSLELGYRGIPEPSGPRVDPDVVDAIVVPGVAFDPVGGRLGRGGGHYDRLLGQLPDDTPRIGICFACQVVPTVPREPHDAAIDVVVTERAVYRTRAREGGAPA